MAETWAGFWHTPIRSERLAAMRWFLGLSLLTDQLFQIYPRLDEFFGPEGLVPPGLFEPWLLHRGMWTTLLFHTSDMEVVRIWFWAWVAACILFTIGLQSRLASVAVWFLSMCFQQRNPNLLNGGDDTLMVGLFLIMLSPCGKALSVDAWIRRVRGLPSQEWTAPWPVRLLQLQLCMIYFTTGIVKLGGTTWWDGTSVHYVLNYVTMSRWSFAQLPLPLWITMILTYSSVWWEILFPLLVLIPGVRPYALWFGILFHIGIYATLEVGWFSFYTMSFYGVWIPDWFWSRSTTSDSVASRTP